MPCSQGNLLVRCSNSDWWPLSVQCEVSRVVSVTRCENMEASVRSKVETLTEIWNLKIPQVSENLQGRAPFMYETMHSSSFHIFYDKSESVLSASHCK